MTDGGEDYIFAPVLHFFEKMKQSNKIRIQLGLAMALVIFGCLLIGAAFFVPPTGEIHPTVLTAFGEILTFAGAVIGVDYSYKKVTFRRRNDDEEDIE